MKIRSFMTRNVTCIGPTESLKQAYDIMKDNEIRHLPVVVENNKLVGMVSERDVLLWSSFDNGIIEVPEMDVDDVMTTNLVTCKTSHQLCDVAEIMLERRIDAIPVTDDLGELLGIITSADFVSFSARKNEYDVERYKSIPFNFIVNRFKSEARSSLGVNGLRTQP